MHGHHLIALTLAVSLVAGCQTERPTTAPVPVATSEPDVEGTVVGDDRTAMEAAIDAGPSAPAGETPIIAMTANVFTHQQDSYREAGMTGAVSKPLSPARLLAEISRLVPRKDEADAETAAVA